jgi:hypothetical protein
MSEELPHDFESHIREQLIVETASTLHTHEVHEAEHVHGAECSHYQAYVHIDHMENVAEENHSNNETHESIHIHNSGCVHVEHENAHDHIDKTHVHSEHCGHIHHHDAKEYIDFHEAHVSSHNHEKHEAEHVHSPSCGHVKHENADEYVDKPHIHTEACGHVSHHEAQQHIDVAREDIPHEHHQKAQEHVHVPGCGHMPHIKAHEHIDRNSHSEELVTPLGHIHAEHVYGQNDYQLDAATDNELSLRQPYPMDTLTRQQETITTSVQLSSVNTAMERAYMQQELETRATEEVEQLQEVSSNENIALETTSKVVHASHLETYEDTAKKPNALVAIAEGIPNSSLYTEDVSALEDPEQMPITFSGSEPSLKLIAEMTPAETTEVTKTTISADILMVEASPESRLIKNETPELSISECVSLSDEAILEPIPVPSGIQWPLLAEVAENGMSDILEKTVRQVSFPEGVTDSSEPAAPEMVAVLEHILEVLANVSQPLKLVQPSGLEDRLLAFGHYLKPADHLELLRNIQNEEINEIITMLERLLEQTKAGIYQEYTVASRFMLPTEDDQTNVSLLGKLVLKLLRSTMVIPAGWTA